MESSQHKVRWSVKKDLHASAWSSTNFENAISIARCKVLVESMSVFINLIVHRAGNFVSGKLGNKVQLQRLLKYNRIMKTFKVAIALFVLSTALVCQSPTAQVVVHYTDAAECAVIMSLTSRFNVGGTCQQNILVGFTDPNTATQAFIATIVYKQNGMIQTQTLSIATHATNGFQAGALWFYGIDGAILQSTTVVPLTASGPSISVISQ